MGKNTKLLSPEQMLTWLLENTQEPFLMTDRSLQVLSFNECLRKKYAQFFGVQLRAGESFLNYTIPERKEAIREICQRVLETGIEEGYHTSIPQPGGDLRTFQLRYCPAKIPGSQEIGGLLISVIDITEQALAQQRQETERKDRQAVEREIRRINERYDLLAKATNDAIWDWDYVSNIVVRTGMGFEKLFGYDSEQATAERDFWSKRVHPDDRARVSGNRKLLIETTQSVYWEDRYRFLKADGQYAYVYDKAYIIRDEDGKALRLIGAMQDITRDTEATEKLQELNLVLDQRARELASSNAELEQFAYIASHDLQEPLRVVTSFLHLLEGKYAGIIDETGSKYIKFAVDAAERMRQLIRDLLEYSRAGTNKDNQEMTDMNGVVQETLKNLNSTIEEKQARLEVGPLPVLNHARKGQMIQLMQNLISNALKYCDAANPIIRIGAREEERKWVFFVKDNGIGIDPRHRERIFVIFQRLHNRNEYSGTGIGLSICKKIVEAHGGQIWVDTNEEEKGSIFYFSLNKTQQEA